MIRRLQTQRRDYFSTYFAFSRHMCSHFLHLKAPFRARVWACSYEAYEWGYSMVVTRAVTTHRLLIPLLDFRNFITTDSVECSSAVCRSPSSPSTARTSARISWTRRAIVFE